MNSANKLTVKNLSLDKRLSRQVVKLENSVTATVAQIEMIMKKLGLKETVRKPMSYLQYYAIGIIFV